MLVRKGQDPWASAESVPFTNEVEFQDLVAETFGQVLATQTDAPAVIVREVVMPDGGRLDILSVDEDGVISLCECKLATNTDVRRKVVGQILEYGGSLSGMGFKEFKSRVDARLAGDMVAAMAAQAGENFDAGVWTDAIEENVTAGQFRLIVAVDAINAGLKRTLVYLNTHSALPILGVELRRERLGDVDVLSPQVFAGELAQTKLPGPPSAPAVEHADTLVVAATHAYNEFKQIGAYICQPHRSFRTDVAEYLGFYAKRRIEPDFPRIVAFRPNITFSAGRAAELRATSDVLDHRVADVIEKALAAELRTAGEPYQVVLLDEGFELAHEIKHHGPTAWLRGQRYTSSEALKKLPATTDELQVLGG
jgi:hypothetical protein